MEVGSPEWIEASLAKLDELERERAQHEAALETADDPAALAQHNEALERLDAEIKALYAQLEAVADEDEDEDEGEDVAAAASPSAGAFADPVAEAPAPAPEPEPATAPEPAADNPFSSPSPDFGAGAGSVGGGGGGFDAAPVAFDDADLKPPGGGAKWAFIGLVVLGGLGVGGYFAWQNMQAQKAEEAPSAPAEEIKIEAAAIPEDTEEPNAAKGGDATISPTANPQTGGGSKSGGGGGGSGGGGGGSKKDSGKNDKPLQIKSGGDPLGGDPLG